MLAGCADRVVLFPSTHAVDAEGARRLMIPFGSGAVEVFIARSPGCALPGDQACAPVAIDLQFIGNGSRAEWTAGPIARRWGSRPVEVWAMNYPGYGRSDGPASLRTIPAAALAVYDALVMANPGRPIVLGAHSLGCAVALHVAAHRPVGGLVLLNPPPLRTLILRQYGWWNLWLGAGVIAAGIPSELDSLANAARVTAPAIVLSADKDRLVPPRFHRLVYNAYAGPKRLIVLKDATHNDSPDEQTAQAFKDGIDWIWPRVMQDKRL